MLFSSNTGRRTIKDIRMTWINALGSIGGSMGLFLGFSLLSFCELIYFAVKILRAMTMRRKPKLNVEEAVKT